VKKKLTLDELEIASFVTTDNRTAVRVGGEAYKTKDILRCNTTHGHSFMPTGCVACPETTEC